MNFELETIQKVVDYIEENLNNELSLDKIAEKAGYSKFHLHRIFSKIVGETIHKYIQKRRLTEAARKLVYTDDSIINIALISGYESQQAFTLAFKKMYKSSPQIYRIKRNFEPQQLSINFEEVFNYYENQCKSNKGLYDNERTRKNTSYKSNSLTMAA